MQVNKGEQHKGEQAFLTSFSFEPPSVCTIPDFQRPLWMDVWWWSWRARCSRGACLCRSI